MDDTWIVNSIHENGNVEISNIRTDHKAVLGSDHIHHFDTDPMSEQDGLNHGFYILKVQLHFINGELTVEPITNS